MEEDEKGCCQLEVITSQHLRAQLAIQIFFIFTPNLGEDEPILTIIFFKGVGSTTQPDQPLPPAAVEPVRSWAVKYHV